MKTWQKLNETQKTGAVLVPTVALGYASVVALIATRIDLVPSMVLSAVLVVIGAISTGVFVAMSKDDTIAKMSRHNTKRALAMQNEIETLRAQVASLDTYREALEMVTSNAVRGENSALDLATYMQEASEARTSYRLALPLVFVGNEYQYGTWDEYDSATVLRVVREWITLSDLALTNAVRQASEAQYTHSASTAFALGTLDKAYTVGNETRYPLA